MVATGELVRRISMRETLAAFALLILAMTDGVPAQDVDITGGFAGSYEGPQGTTVFTLSLNEGERGLLPAC
jgi:hypothetical protein